MVNAYFLDTSALVKKYMTEVGTTWLETLTAPDLDNKIILARVTWVEAKVSSQRALVFSGPVLHR
jgi:hypothetical protein